MLTDEQLFALMRKHLTDSQRKALTITRWKDGIDIDEPAYGLHRIAEEPLTQARADALEDAAKVAHELASAWHTADEISAAIRARKDAGC